MKNLDAVPHLPDISKDLLYAQPLANTHFNGMCAETLKDKQDKKANVA